MSFKLEVLFDLWHAKKRQAILQKAQLSSNTNQLDFILDSFCYQITNQFTFFSFKVKSSVSHHPALFLNMINLMLMILILLL